MRYLTFLVLASTIMVSCSKDSDENTPQPQASFTFSSTNNFKAPSTVSFTNQSANAQQYSWDFGDGTPLSNNVNPIHEFTSPGKYHVVLIASNGSKFDETAKEVEIFALPEADFSLSSDNDFIAPTLITFDNESEFGTSYHWDFGDGETSTLENPTHQYSTPGEYTITLTAKNNVGEDAIEKSVLVVSSKVLLIDNLVGTWHTQSVTYDGDDQMGDYAGFQISILKASGEAMTFTTSGRPAKLTPWDASGTFIFGPSPDSQLERGDGVELKYAVDGNTLVLTMENYSGTGYNGRTSTVAGDWIFTLTK